MWRRVSPVLNTNLVQSGPVRRKGYTSMVTAGPKTGFGLLPVDGGIAFYNSQSLFFVTLIHDFQQQLSQDPRGQQAASSMSSGDDLRLVEPDDHGGRHARRAQPLAS